MAYGFLCAASGVSGVAMPFCIRFLLEKHGYETTLRIIAVGIAAFTASLIPLLKGRLPQSEVRASPQTDWIFLRNFLFWVYTCSNFCMGLGYFFPSLYLPFYAASNDLNSTQGALLLAIMSGAQVLGQVTFGWLSDRRTLPLKHPAHHFHGRRRCRSIHDMGSYANVQGHARICATVWILRCRLHSDVGAHGHLAQRRAEHGFCDFWAAQFGEGPWKCACRSYWWSAPAR